MCFATLEVWDSVSDYDAWLSVTRPSAVTDPVAPADHHTFRLDRACLRGDRPDE